MVVYPQSIDSIKSTGKNKFERRSTTMNIRTSNSKEFLSLEELIKLHDASLNVCPIDSDLNTLAVDPETKAHSRRKIVLNKDDLLQYFNKQGYATRTVALNCQKQPVPHLMPYNSHEADDFANLLKSQLSKVIKKKYPQSCGAVFHLDEAVPHVHVFFKDYDATTTTSSYQPRSISHSKSANPNSTDQQAQFVNNQQQMARQKQEQLHQLRQRQVQIAIKNAEDKKKKLEKQRQIRLRRRRYRQNDGPDL